MRQLYPFIDRINLAKLLNWISRIANSVNELLMLFGTISIVVGVLTVVATVVVIVQGTKELQKEFRKGKLRREYVLIQFADEYLGLHCVNIVLTFFFGMFVCGSMLTLGAYVYYHFTVVLEENFTLLVTIGVRGASEIVIAKTLAMLVTRGLHVSTPGVVCLLDASRWSSERLRSASRHSPAPR